MKLMLDAYCGAGGATRGYQEAGFRVVGVDVAHQANYPGIFVRADAIEYIKGYGHLFDAIHSSPPCQAHTTMSNKHRGRGTAADLHVEMIAATRDAMNSTGKPWILENVHGAARHLRNPISLYGGSFGLRVHRPRFFESNVALIALPRKRAVNPIGVYGRHHDGRLLWRNQDGSELHCARTLEEAQTAMGIDWMTWDEITEAVPPAYTAYLGKQLLAVMACAA